MLNETSPKRIRLILSPKMKNVFRKLVAKVQNFRSGLIFCQKQLAGVWESFRRSFSQESVMTGGTRPLPTKSDANLDQKRRKF